MEKKEYTTLRKAYKVDSKLAVHMKKWVKEDYKLDATNKINGLLKQLLDNIDKKATRKEIKEDIIYIQYRLKQMDEQLFKERVPKGAYSRYEMTASGRPRIRQC